MVDLLKKLKGILEGKSRKKLVENAVIVIIIGVIIIIAGRSFFSGSGSKGNQTASAGKTESASDGGKTTVGMSDIESKLKNILSQISGAGKVDVMITYSVSKENVPAYDVKKSESSTDEKDSGGGTRKIGESSNDTAIVFENGQNGEKTPVILKELEPVVKGVLVVAEGAANPEVREKICKAVQVLMDVPIHKVQVIERRK